VDRHLAVAYLALACRQDSGSEFHLNDQEVKKYKADVESLGDKIAIWEDWISKGVMHK
jgi:hypothetical protein